MNYLLHLNAFLSMAEKSSWMGPYHYALYMVLFNRWNRCGFKHSFNVIRQDIMHSAKIGSKSTYYSCMKKLQEESLLQFHQAQSRYIAAAVTMIRLDLHAGCQEFSNGLPQGTEKGHKGPFNKTVQVSDMGLFNTNRLNNLINEGVKGAPNLDDVIQFFISNSYPKEEALKFFYWYEGSNWISGRQTTIANWEPFAHKWMLNPQSPKLLSNEHQQKDSDYNEPF